MAEGSGVEGRVGAQGPVGVAGHRLEILSKGGPGQPERGGGESGLDHRALVGEVQRDAIGGRLGHGRPVDAADGHAPGPARQDLERPHDLRRRAAPRDSDDEIVGTAQRKLGGRERVGLAITGLFTERGIRLGHEQRGAAADREDTVTRRRQDVGDLGREPGHPSPRLGLAGDLAHDFAHSRRLYCRNDHLRNPLGFVSTLYCSADAAG
jgi:hypothetical protein